jgi:hypothetical protein
MSNNQATLKLLSAFERFVPVTLSALTNHKKTTPEAVIQNSCVAIVACFCLQGQSQLVSGTTCEQQT